MNIFLKGLMLGFSIAAPVGPIGVLCIQRTLRYGRLAGIASGLGAALADAFYGMVVVVGLTSLTQCLLTNQKLLALFGGLFLIYLGVKTLLQKSPSLTDHTMQATTLTHNFLSTFALTLTNPMTMLAFAAMLTSISVYTTTQGTLLTNSLFVSGVFIGSMLWWIFLALITGSLRSMMNQKLHAIINYISGSIICLYGIWTLIKLW